MVCYGISGVVNSFLCPLSPQKSLMLRLLHSSQVAHCDILKAPFRLHVTNHQKMCLNCLYDGRLWKVTPLLYALQISVLFRDNLLLVTITSARSYRFGHIFPQSILYERHVRLSCF